MMPPPNAAGTVAPSSSGELAMLSGADHGRAADPQAALRPSIEDFQRILTDEQRHKLSQIGATNDADNFIVFTAELEAENQASGRPGVARRFDAVLQCVPAFSSVVETFVSSHPEIAALVWGSVKMTMLVSIQPIGFCEH